MIREFTRLNHGKTSAASSGMTILELVVSTGIVSLGVLALASILFQARSSQARAQSKQAVLSGIAQTASAFQRGQCASILTASKGPSLLSAEDTPMRIEMPSLTLEAGRTISDPVLRSYRVDKVYLSDKDILSSSSGLTTLSANLYIEASSEQGGTWLPFAKTMISSLTLRADSSGAMIACETPAEADKKSLCEAIEGMVWNETLQNCTQDIERESGSRFACPDGMIEQNGACVLSGSSCPYGTLPQGFGDGLVGTCANLPTGRSLSYPANAVVPGAPSSLDNQATGGSSGVKQAEAPKTCICGSGTVPITESSTTTLCAQARNIGNEIGGFIDLDGDLEVTVMKCVGGELQRLGSYYDEESDHIWRGWQPKSCTPAGQWSLTSKPRGQLCR